LTVLFVAVALDIAVHLIEAIAPVLIGLGIGAVIGYVGWLIRDNRRSRW
jgi:NhaP-type Na+/H+ or K+/H+ antiporter